MTGVYLDIPVDVTYHSTSDWIWRASQTVRPMADGYRRSRTPILQRLGDVWNFWPPFVRELARPARERCVGIRPLPGLPSGRRAGVSGHANAGGDRVR